jgi:hypothetical protein
LYSLPIGLGIFLGSAGLLSFPSFAAEVVFFAFFRKSKKKNHLLSLNLEEEKVHHK